MARQIHIGIDARMFANGFTGIGRYTKELLHHLIALRPDWKFTLFLAPDQYRKFTPPTTNVRKVRAPEKHYSWGEQTSFLRRISRIDFDLFHFPHFNAPLFYRRPSVVTIHDLTISFFPGKKKRFWFQKWAYRRVLSSIVRRAKRIIAVSEHTKKDLQELLGTPGAKIRVIWNGLGPEFKRENQDRRKLGTVWSKIARRHLIAKPYFLYTGVHREHKNVAGMIAAFARFLQNGGAAELVITGKEDPYYPEIDAAIRKYGLKEQVKKVGLVSEAELKALFFNAHAFIFPSFHEGFGLPPLEAMAMEIPVIASSTSSIPEICGDAAEYFDPYDPMEMSAKMQLVFADQDKRQELIAEGKKRIRLFSWEKMAEETLAVYEEILSAKS